MFYGGSDDDLAFAESKVDLNGRPIKYASLAEMVHTLKPEIENDRRVFLTAMDQIKQAMILGVDKNVYAEGSVSGTAGVGRGSYFGPGAHGPSCSTPGHHRGQGRLRGPIPSVAVQPDPSHVDFAAPRSTSG